MSVKPSSPALFAYLIIALYVPSGLYAKTDPMGQNKNDKLTEDDKVGKENREMPMKIYHFIKKYLKHFYN